MRLRLIHCIDSTATPNIVEMTGLTSKGSNTTPVRYQNSGTIIASMTRPWEWRMNSAKRNALLAVVWISMINFGMRNAVLSDTEMWTLGYLS